MHLQIFSQKTQKKVCLFRKKAYLCTGFEKKPEKYRGVEQLVARWAHNPKVVCSSQASATIRVKESETESISRSGAVGSSLGS